MPRMTWNIWKLLRRLNRHSSRVRPHRNVNPATGFLEVLEARALPTGTASAEIAGIAFLDANRNTTRSADETLIRGIPVQLTGQTTKGAPVGKSVTTDANGAYRRTNVLPGTYTISAGPGASFTGTGVSLGQFTVTGGQTLTRDFAFVDGIRPGLVSLRNFLNTSTIADIPFAAAGAGTAPVNDRENNLPVLLPDAATSFAVGKNRATTTFDLANVFTDQDMTNSQVRFATSVGNINVELLDTDAPQNVANFFNYVTDNRYDNTVFHRVIAGFVAQGGGFRLDGNGNQVAILKDPPVANEFEASNVRGTIAMAKVGGLGIASASESTTTVTITTVQSLSLSPGDSVIIEGVGVTGYNGTFTIESVISPTQFTYQNSTTGLAVSSGGTLNNPNGTVSLPNSATNEFFFNLANNSANLNNQNGGFTVFGRVAAADLAIMDAVGATANNAVTVSDIAIVRRDEFLTYSVIGNTNESLVTASIVNNRLTLSHTPGTTGTAVLTIRATDKLGATFQTTFPVSIADQLPVATVSLSPTAPVGTATLTATATKRDPDSDPVTLDYEWSINGVVVQTTTDTNNLTDTLDLTSPTILIQLPTPPVSGDLIRVRVTPNDNQSDGMVVSAMTFINRVPVISSVELSSLTPTTNAMLTATVVATDADSDPISLTYEWSVNGTPVQTSSSNTFDLSGTGHGDLGDQITLVVTPSDGKESGQTASPTAPAVVAASLPVVDSFTLDPDMPATTTNMLTAAATASDADGLPVTLTYEWSVRGVIVRTMSEVNLTSDSLDTSTLMLAVNDEISVKVTPKVTPTTVDVFGNPLTITRTILS